MPMNINSIKNLIILSFIFFFNIVCFSQELKYGQLQLDGPFKRHKSYLASDGTIYKTGDKIKIGLPFSACNSSFCFCSSSEGKLGVGSSGQVVEIAYFQVNGNENTGFFVRMYTDWGGIARFYVFEFENALKTKELIGNVVSSDDALLELKKEKEKLDLQIITQEEYDKRKNELMKYIK